MAILYIAAGANHFIHPRTYLRIMPPYVPYPGAMVIISGIAEISLGLLLLPCFSRPFAAWGIIVLLIAVFPANIQMAIDWQRRANPMLWIAYARLPLQIILVWWAWLYTKQA